MTEPATAAEINLDQSAASEADGLIAELYAELRTIAHREHYRAGMPQTLQTTVLISEAYVRLQRREGWASRQHFLACAATAMRHILIDAARARMTAKRSADLVPLNEATDAGVADDSEIVRLGDALKTLSGIDEELARLVDCRFFAGFDEKETAQVLGISDRTVRRRWTQARAWIHREMLAA